MEKQANKFLLCWGCYTKPAIYLHQLIEEMHFLDGIGRDLCGECYSQFLSEGRLIWVEKDFIEEKKEEGEKKINDF